MNRRRERLAQQLLIAGALLMAATGCGDGADEAAADEALPNGAIPGELAAIGESTSDSTDSSQSDPNASSIDRNATHLAWYSSRETDSARSVPYLVRSSNTESDVLLDGEIVAEVPFGMSPGAGRYRIWSADGSGGASHSRRPIIWPAECLGIAPDIDGDALLDDCDPYPTDGPDADHDGDGVLNPDDNCPTLANRGQERIGDRHEGLACDEREGLSPAIWFVDADVTLDDWNEVRADRRLNPIEMPTGDEALAPAVAEWCEEFRSIVEWTPQATRNLFEATPDEYGFDEAGTTQLADFKVATHEVMERFAAISTGEELFDSPEELNRVAAELERQLADIDEAAQSYYAVLEYSDQACFDDGER